MIYLKFFFKKISLSLQFVFAREVANKTMLLNSTNENWRSLLWFFFQGSSISPSFFSNRKVIEKKIYIIQEKLVLFSTATCRQNVKEDVVASWWSSSGGQTNYRRYRWDWFVPSWWGNVEKLTTSERPPGP